ncbi:MAG: hypothetical protein ACLGJD_13560 [Gammaproteobacteria bacterium]
MHTDDNGDVLVVALTAIRYRRAELPLEKVSPMAPEHVEQLREAGALRDATDEEAAAYLGATPAGDTSASSQAAAKVPRKPAAKKALAKAGKKS